MAGIDKLLQVLRFTIPGGRRIEPGDLVTPGAIIGMFHDRHEFDMGIMHLHEIGDEAVLQFQPGKQSESGFSGIHAFLLLHDPAGGITGAGMGIGLIGRCLPPGTRMDFIDVEGLLERISCGSRGHPGTVPPGVVLKVPADGSGLRRALCEKGERIRLEVQLTGRGQNFIFVHIALAQPGHEDLPDAGSTHPAHRMPSAVPVVEGADHADSFCGRGPDREGCTCRTVMLLQMASEFFKSLVMGAFIEEMKIVLRQGRPETIRVFRFK